MLVSLIILFFRSHENRKDLPQILQEKTLHVVIKNDSIYGFHYQIVKHFADSMGLKLDITIDNSLNRSIAGLKNGKYDIIANNILVTTQLRKEISFSNAILLNKQVLVQRSDNEKIIRNQLDLAGKTVHVPENSPSILRIKNLAHEIGDTIKIVELPHVENAQMIKMVENGDIDYGVCDQRIARINLSDDLDIKTAIGFSQIECWGLSKHAPKLREAINKFLDSFMKTDTYREIYDKYYLAKNKK